MKILGVFFAICVWGFSFFSCVVKYTKIRLWMPVRDILSLFYKAFPRHSDNMSLSRVTYVGKQLVKSGKRLNKTSINSLIG